MRPPVPPYLSINLETQRPSEILYSFSHDYTDGGLEESVCAWILVLAGASQNSKHKVKKELDEIIDAML